MVNKKAELEKRKGMYKEPMKFLNNIMYESDILANIQLEHWEAFDESSKIDGFKIGDFIDVATRLTANQIVEMMNELLELKTIEEVHELIEEFKLEVYKEIEPNEPS